MSERRDKGRKQEGVNVLSEEVLTAKLLSLIEASRQEDELRDQADRLHSTVIKLRSDITSPIEKVDKENEEGETPFDVVNGALWEIYEDPGSLKSVKTEIMAVYQANKPR